MGDIVLITNGGLYMKIKHFRDDGLSYGKIAARLLPEKSKESKSAARAIVYKFFMHHTPITDKAVRKELSLEVLYDGVPRSQMKMPPKDTRKRHRIAISKLDPASAARSIRENCYFTIDELMEELSK